MAFIQKGMDLDHLVKSLGFNVSSGHFIEQGDGVAIMWRNERGERRKPPQLFVGRGSADMGLNNGPSPNKRGL